MDNKDGENLRAFTAEFGQEFFLSQADYWIKHILIRKVAKDNNDIEAEYYSSMGQAVNSIANKFNPPFFNPYKQWFPFYEVVLTLEEIEILKGIIGDNHAFLQKRIEDKKSLGNFMEIREEEKELKKIETWVTNIAPSLSDSIGKRFFKLYKKEINEDDPLVENKAVVDELTFVDSAKIKKISEIKNNDFDLIRLVGYLNELNVVYRNGCFLSTIFLLRAIIDHIPPIFNAKSFSEVIGNNFSKSEKDLFDRLDDCSRKIADLYLHLRIRKKENLPTAVQVNFASELDILLDEIIKKLE